MPTLKGTEASLSYVQCFLYLISSSINVFIFHITWLDTFWTVLIHITCLGYIAYGMRLAMAGTGTLESSFENINIEVLTG